MLCVRHLSRTAARLPTSSAHRRLSSQSSSPPPFEKILIANRGEIACRVVRTCRRVGVRTVAVYSDADGPESLHASMADECYRVGVGPSPAESYLRGEEVLDVALRAGAQAIHPGYGFLSENPTFAALTSDSDVRFIGPPPSAIEAMGSKSRSKAIMEEAGVPCTPGYHGDDQGEEGQSEERLLHEAVHTVGFPLLIKAVMGGGGKGMRLVHSEGDFLSALESCRRESLASFGDDRVILERYLVDPRHVEVQVVADAHGNCVHLYERDCSLQRRHQKIIEEAPAGDLPAEVREEMGRMAVKAAQAVGYVNAGTVEFLLDTAAPPATSTTANGANGVGGGGYYFCEMNTRLQVEHPITELITRQDLVEWQLRVAAGEELPIKDQARIPCVGHAFEARIYAENPARDFLPATGKVWHHDTPAPPNVGAVPVQNDGGSSNGGTAVRVDTGIQTGRDITVHYDPMISKLIVHGPDRSSSLTALVNSLERYRIAGVPTNVPFLIECASHPAFGIAGGVDTGFLDKHAEDIQLVDGEDGTPLERALSVVAVSLLLENRAGLSGPLEEARRRGGGVNSANARGGGGPWSHLSGSWRMGGKEGRFHRTLRPPPDLDCGGGGGSGGSPSVECVSNRDGSFDMKVITNGQGTSVEFTLDARLNDEGRMDVILNKTHHLSFAVATRENIDEGSIEAYLWSRRGEHSGGSPDTDSIIGHAWRSVFRHPLPTGSSSSTASSPSAAAAATGASAIKSPMPGKITKIHKSEGEAVAAGEVVLVMEAMKMEHSIESPADGIVSVVDCRVGDIVNDGAVLLVVVKEEAEREDGGDAESTA